MKSPKDVADKADSGGCCVSSCCAFLFRLRGKIVNLCVFRTPQQRNSAQAILLYSVSLATGDNLAVTGLEMPIPISILLGLPNFVFLLAGHVS